jgi:hypothetical protein
MDVTPNVRLDIGELVLDGLEGVDPGAVAAAMQTELTRRMAAGVIPAAWRETGGPARLDVPRLDVPAGADAGTVGAAIAGALMGGGGR